MVEGDYSGSTAVEEKELGVELSSTAKIRDEFLLSYGSKNMTQGSQNVLLLSNGKEGKEIHVLRIEGGVCLDLVGTLIQLETSRQGQGQQGFQRGKCRLWSKIKPLSPANLKRS